jgi:cation-transporting P-type ATPase I
MDPRRSPGQPQATNGLFVLDSHADRGSEPLIVHSSRGRLRVHLPLWTGKGERQIERQLVRLPGVRSVQASSLTGNVLLRYDPTRTNAGTLLAEARALRLCASPPDVVALSEKANLPPVVTEGSSKEGRARIAVRGLDRNPRFSRSVVQMLRQRGVRAWAKPLTGHVLVEYDSYEHVLKGLIAMVARVELPALPGEDRPEHPLDPMPLWQGVLRAVCCALGLGFITIRQLRQPSVTMSTGHGGTETIAGIINLLHGVPTVKHHVNGWIGKDSAELLLDAVGIFTMTLSGFSLGLIVTGLEALILLDEVTARRAAWRRYEDNLDGSAGLDPGGVARLEAGATVPHAAEVIEGTGTALDQDGLPVPLSPGAIAPAGAVLSGGPFVLEIKGGNEFEPQPRPVPSPRDIYDDYRRVGGFLAMCYVAFTAVRTLSIVRTFEAALLMNPRTAVIAEGTANLAAAARALRAGTTVIGTRSDRPIRLPHVLLLDGSRLLSDGLEIAEVCTPNPAVLASEVLAVAAIISAAAGSPWGNPFPKARGAIVSGGEYNGLWATATVDGYRYSLGPPEDLDRIPAEFWSKHIPSRGGYLLELRNDDEQASFGLIALRPKISGGTNRLVEVARRLGVKVKLLCRAVSLPVKVAARRAEIEILLCDNAAEAIRQKQRQGALVAFVSDNSGAAEAFAACDFAIGIGSARSGEFPARADVLAPDLRGVADLLETGRKRDRAVRDGVHLSVVANMIGATLGLRPNGLGVERASLAVYLTAISLMGAVSFRLRGGHRPTLSLAHLSDPRPERWARRSLEDVLRTLHATEHGLSSAEAADRRPTRSSHSSGDQLLISIRNQVTTPITGVLGAGACLTLVLGQPLNTALLAITTTLNVAVGVWQEREVGKAAEAIQRLSAGTARVLRDRRTVHIRATDVVAGDIVLLGPGDRVSADARMLSAAGLEVNEAALTGESLPVPKGPDEFTDFGRIVLEGSDVVVGTGRAVVVAVGRQTRLGATAAALNVGRQEYSPMGQRLSKILQIALPLSAAGGVAAGIAGLLYGGAAAGQLAVGVTTALSAIPEGLPLMAGVGQAGVANRLAARGVLVRRIAAVEALGRVDVACTDKTGTMTEGRLALRLVADLNTEVYLPGTLPEGLRQLLLTAALASPHPDAPDAVSHPTDLAVVRGAVEAGLTSEVKAPRLAEIAFDSARAFHASVVPGRLCVKGAPEKLIPRCSRVRKSNQELAGSGFVDLPIDAARRNDLLDRVTGFAERGLRVLLVAEGPQATSPDDPHGLTVLGFVAISDPLRAGVPEAVRRCQLAGIRVIMLTGDHPATAKSIAREAGLLQPGNDRVLRAADMAELDPEELDEALKGVAVIARAAPLDKLHVIESLRRCGHIVAMTGDGVNDAPSLRLADVGVAMGQGGTEVARQASDVVLIDDDFATLVEALVEGRGFWRNMRIALGLLLGGNAGELGVIVGASLMGFGPPLSTVQILLVNLLTDALPALAVVLQRPQNRDLAELAREGLSALDSGLRRDVLRRGLATAVPTLGSYLFMQSTGDPAQASAVAFASVVATQLAQTLDAGRVQGAISRSVINAVGVSAGLLGTSIALPPLRNFLGLTMPSRLGWGAIGASTVFAVLISRAISELAQVPEAAEDSHSLEESSIQESIPIIQVVT